MAEQESRRAEDRTEGQLPRYVLPRRSILRGRKKFDRLFAEGKTLRAGDLLLRWYLVDAEEIEAKGGAAGPLAAFVVAKRYGRAVDRNRVKRLMREAWRLQRPGLVEQLDESARLEIAIVWIGPPAAKGRAKFAPLAANLAGGIDRLVRRISRRHA